MVSAPSPPLHKNPVRQLSTVKLNFGLPTARILQASGFAVFRAALPRRARRVARLAHRRTCPSRRPAPPVCSSRRSRRSARTILSCVCRRAAGRRGDCGRLITALAANGPQVALTLARGDLGGGGKTVPVSQAVIPAAGEAGEPGTRGALSGRYLALPSPRVLPHAAPPSPFVIPHAAQRRCGTGEPRACRKRFERPSSDLASPSPGARTVPEHPPASPYSSSERKSVSRPVSRVLYGAALLPHVTAIHLGRPLPGASRNQPGRLAWKGPDPLRGPRRPYSVLLPVGFTVPLPLPVARWALTPPFHPYRGRSRGGLLSVALSLGSPPPGVTRHRFSVEPGLSSPAAFPRLRERPSSRLTRDW